MGDAELVDSMKGAAAAEDDESVWPAARGALGGVKLSEASESVMTRPVDRLPDGGDSSSVPATDDFGGVLAKRETLDTVVVGSAPLTSDELSVGW